ncbi:hypothetical protein [Bradyrhizobium septentrionale]|uniref:Uncharacterized protein n=1 Tax=Bradyrhizobium septentrionale TaxID=1404411 RepID=A0ABZ2P712_9BRAD
MENEIVLLVPDQHAVKSKLPSFGSSAAKADGANVQIIEAKAYLHALFIVRTLHLHENEHERSQREREWTFAPPDDGIFNLL